MDIDFIDPSEMELICSDFPYWHCQDGTVLHYTKMSDSHIKNALTLIIKHAEKGVQWRTDFVIPMTRELKHREELKQAQETLTLEQRVERLEKLVKRLQSL